MSRFTSCWLALGVSLLGSLMPSFGADLGLKIEVDFAGTTHTFPPTPEGIAGAERVLARAYPGDLPSGTPRYRETFTFQQLQKFRDPTYMETLSRITNLSAKNEFFVRFAPADNRDQVYPGETLLLPDGTSYEVQAGDSVASIATAKGTTIDAVVDANRSSGRFEYGPYVQTRDGLRVIALGETGMNGWTSDFGDIPGMVVHEASHVGDDSRCAKNVVWYGVDTDHHAPEILAPAVSFMEGWADYQAWHIGGFWVNLVAYPRRNLRVESAKPAGTPGAGYQNIEERDLIVNDYLSNETNVAAMLMDIEGLAPGRDAVDAAFLKTQGQECRSIAHWLQAYLTENATARDKVAQIYVTRTWNLGTEAQLDTMAAGEGLPNCQDPWNLPRPQEYTPSVVPGGAPPPTTVPVPRSIPPPPPFAPRPSGEASSTDTTLFGLSTGSFLQALEDMGAAGGTQGNTTASNGIEPQDQRPPPRRGWGRSIPESAGRSVNPATGQSGPAFPPPDAFAIDSARLGCGLNPVVTQGLLELQQSTETVPGPSGLFGIP